jgi:hypothetical protein
MASVLRPSGVLTPPITPFDDRGDVELGARHDAPAGGRVHAAVA